MSEQREVMNLQSVREYLGVSETLIRELLASRRIPAAKVGRVWRFRRSEIDAWLAAGGTNSMSQAAR